MELIAPLKLADSSWDNVGLLVESPVELKHASVLVTNDLTSKVLCEALDKQVGMIISYHPPWFKPSKSLLSSSGALNYINLCLSHGISIFSPHTALDAVSGGSTLTVTRPWPNFYSQRLDLGGIRWKFTVQ